MVAEFVVVAKSTAATSRRTQRVEFAPATGNALTNAFASSCNVASLASADYNMGEHWAKCYHFGYSEPRQSPVAQKLQRR